MPTTKEILKVKDFAETVKGITGLAKENYLNDEETLNLTQESLEKAFSLFNDYINLFRKV